MRAFIPGHVVMVAIHGWSNFASMWTGGGGTRIRSGSGFGFQEQRLGADQTICKLNRMNPRQQH
jgi:hypothetical protein